MNAIQNQMSEPRREESDNYDFGSLPLQLDFLNNHETSEKGKHFGSDKDMVSQNTLNKSPYFNPSELNLTANQSGNQIIISGLKDANSLKGILKYFNARKVKPQRITENYENNEVILNMKSYMDC